MELIVNLLLWNEEYGKSILRSFMKVPEFKNDCYSTLGEAGSEYAKQKGIEAVKFELAICRSAFKLGILEGLKGQISHDKSKEYIAHLCDQDPEKNGCTDGVGRLAYFYGFSAKESSELCKVGEVGVAEIETYFEGCMGSMVTGLALVVSGQTTPLLMISSQNIVWAWTREAFQVV